MKFSLPKEFKEAEKDITAFIFSKLEKDKYTFSSYKVFSKDEDDKKNRNRFSKSYERYSLLIVIKTEEGKGIEFYFNRRARISSKEFKFDVYSIEDQSEFVIKYLIDLHFPMERTVDECLSKLLESEDDNLKLAFFPIKEIIPVDAVILTFEIGRFNGSVSVIFLLNGNRHHIDFEIDEVRITNVIPLPILPPYPSLDIKVRETHSCNHTHNGFFKSTTYNISIPPRHTIKPSVVGNLNYNDKIEELLRFIK